LQLPLDVEIQHRDECRRDAVLGAGERADPVIDPEFAALLPPLPMDTLTLLERSIARTGGARDPLTTWRGILLDGHQRFAICKRLHLPFKTEEVGRVIETREEAMLWIEENQLGRKNLSEDQVAAMTVRLIEAARAAGDTETLADLAADYGDAAVYGDGGDDE
jgi:hypothetical protein